MNLIFTVVFIVSSILMLAFHPERYITALQNGGSAAFSLFCKLVVLYAVWLGFFGVVKACKLNEKIAKLFRPINRFLFGKISDEANGDISLNLSCSLLGLGGASTAMALKGMKSLEGGVNGDNAMCMLFVLNATAIQILPTSVISLRAEYGSLNPSDIILPTFLATVVAAATGILLCKLFQRRKKCRA